LQQIAQPLDLDVPGGAGWVFGRARFRLWASHAPHSISKDCHLCEPKARPLDLVGGGQRL